MRKSKPRAKRNKHIAAAARERQQAGRDTAAARAAAAAAAAAAALAETTATAGNSGNVDHELDDGYDNSGLLDLPAGINDDLDWTSVTPSMEERTSWGKFVR